MTAKEVLRSIQPPPEPLVIPAELIQKALKQRSGWGFTEGLVLGQLSVIVTVIIILKFVIFAENKSPKKGNDTAKDKEGEQVVVGGPQTNGVKTSGVRRNKSSTNLRNRLAGAAGGPNSRPGSSRGSMVRSVSGGTPTLSSTSAGSAASSASNLAPASATGPTTPTTIAEGVEPSESAVVDHLDLDLSPVDEILHKTSYPLASHAPESLDWFNVLVAQIITQLRFDAKANNNQNLLNSLDAAFNAKRPDFIDRINVTEINLGDDYPILSNCKITHKDTGPASNASGNNVPNNAEYDDSRLEAQMDIDLSDTITLGIETRLNLNQPKILSPFLSLSTSLPVSLSVTIVRFTARLNISLYQQIEQTEEDEKDKRDTILSINFEPDYKLQLSVKSLVGSRSRLQNVPTLESLVDSKIQKWFRDHYVEPHQMIFILPSLWPRKKRSAAAGAETATAAAATSS
ncbi:Maintenance of mitochondrial morphology protein 1-2 [Yarrowia sp. B02]|nr:Maintenance of mitochondrial morphology protein 1-2 [Yarrowia sp. B02]